MPSKGNQMIPNRHFHKDWQRYIKTWFNQPMKAKRRKQKRVVKAAKLAPRPVNKLRPIIRCPTFKDNTKVREGRGFTTEELAGAGYKPGFAQTIGISFDPRRRNHCMESLQLNIQRLKEYQSKLILFPHKKAKAPKAGEATPEEISKATQLVGKILPVSVKVDKSKVDSMVITDEMKNFKAFHTIRQARAHKRLFGKRAKAKKDAEEAALATKK